MKSGEEVVLYMRSVCQDHFFFLGETAQSLLFRFSAVTVAREEVAAFFRIEGGHLVPEGLRTCFRMRSECPFLI